MKDDRIIGLKEHYKRVWVCEREERISCVCVPLLLCVVCCCCAMAVESVIVVLFRYWLNFLLFFPAAAAAAVPILFPCGIFPVAIRFAICFSMSTAVVCLPPTAKRGERKPIHSFHDWSLSYSTAQGNTHNSENRERAREWTRSLFSHTDDSSPALPLPSLSLWFSLCFFWPI